MASAMVGSASISSSLYPHQAKVLLHARIEEVRHRIGPRDGLFARVSDTTCTMELGAPTLDVLAARVLWLGVDFEVITTEALRRHLETVAARLERASRPAAWSTSLQAPAASPFPSRRRSNSSSSASSRPSTFK